MNGMFCDKESLKKLIGTFEQYRKDTSAIVLIQPKDLESINLNEISSNVYFIPYPYLNCGKSFVLQNELKDSAWNLIQKGEINFKRGEFDGLQD